MKTVDELMTSIFGVARDPRSDEYKAGVLAVLNWRLNGVRVVCPYGSLVQQDAFFSGCGEGHLRADDANIPQRRAAA